MRRNTENGDPKMTKKIKKYRKTKTKYNNLK